MREYKEVVIPERTETRCCKITCDLCGSEIKSTPFEVNDVTIKYKTGTNYPEGSWGEEFSYDVCHLCFHAKIVPVFDKPPEVKEWEW